MSVTITISENTNPEAKDLNVSNTNFFDLWSGLGLVPHFCGEINPNTLLTHVSKYNPTDLLKDDVELSENHIDCGRTLTQVERYLATLMSIGLEAQRQENQIIWY